jgi:ribosomal protein S18 acetylase RimI-like enzyme
MLSFRAFDFARDAKTWADIFNASYAGWPDHVPMTPERIRWWMEAPSYDPESLEMAELDGAAVGIVESRVDPGREERKGFLGDVAILPEFRRRGLGRELFREAQRSLRARGMGAVEMWLWDGAVPSVKLAESEGCKVARSFCNMAMNLDGWTEREGPKRAPPGALEIILSNLSKEDIILQNRLDNEGFKEHYNHRPVAVEETEYKLLKDPNIERVGMHFALLAGEPVGYVITSVDRKHHELTGSWRGDVMDITVLKPHRKLGIGEALVRRGLAALKSQGVSEARLGVDEMNHTGAVPLYAKVGFRVATRYLAYVKVL